MKSEKELEEINKRLSEAQDEIGRVFEEGTAEEAEALQCACGGQLVFTFTGGDSESPGITDCRCVNDNCLFMIHCDGVTEVPTWAPGNVRTEIFTKRGKRREDYEN